MAQTSQSVGSPLPNPPTGPAKGATVPFRRATTERVQILPAEALTMTTAEQQIQRNTEGSGYVYGIGLQVVATAASNAATVVYAEDAPWNALSSVIYEDVNGQLINVNGYDLYLADLANKNYSEAWPSSATAGAFGQSSDTNLFNLVAGSGGTGGSFTFWLEVPIGTNRRDLRGILGNQDRAQKYMIRTNLAPSGSVYSTPPTTLPPVAINKFYENYSVPLPTSPTGASQEVIPPDFGTIHYLTATLNESTPVGGSQVNHYLRRIGNTIRWVILQFRSNSSRATAQTNAPTNIQFKVGEDTIFNESYAYRRFLMYQRYGFDWPNGILIYEALHDFDSSSGFEVGDDYYHTQALVNAQFIITYPSGFGSTANSLRILTDDLQYVQPSAGVAVSA